MENYHYTNRLINEKSPYLLQHAHNPVDWYPWGDEAFEAAKLQDKPIFLSIGYATCHWCHTMEKESFENIDVAQLMNQAFINIKVDREELPEIDSLYMEFAQSMMAGAAGWPLNLILTPELKPFFATTYLPPYSKHGLIGLSDLIKRIEEVWTSEEKEKVTSQASKVVATFQNTIHIKGDEIIEKEQIEEAAELLFKMADPIYGGIKGAPKFPIAYQNNFMLRFSSMNKDGRALFLVERTLDMMHRGGIYDHLGGGFSRYSVDEEWLVPHFEKMLYDNALLSSAYLEAWQMTKNPLYKRVCEEVLNYVLRDMTHSEGGFYSAEDADSEGHEGLFYTWTIEEIKKVLVNNFEVFCEFYGVTKEGNFEGRNILHTKLSLEEFAIQKNLDPIDISTLITSLRKKMWQEREKRIHPFKDDKILSSWNGLMIFALAEAGASFNETAYIDAAKKSADFIRKHLWQEHSLLRRWREDEALYSAGLDEYAFMIKGLISLFEVSGESEWLQLALEMTRNLSQQFKAEEGAFYQTDGLDEAILLRKCQFSDGAEPSGNAVHCENLLHLYQLSQEDQFLEEAQDIIKAVKKFIDNYPPGYCYHLIALERYYDKQAPTIVIGLNHSNQFKKEISQLIFQKFIPHKAVIWNKLDDKFLHQRIPSTLEQLSVENKTTVYICYGGYCQKPLNELSEIIEAIHKL